MATLYVTIGDVGARVENGLAVIFSAENARSETVTTSGTSAAGALTANKKQACQVFSSVAHYIKTGPAGVTVSATNGYFVPANIPMYFSMSENDVVAGIEA